jgi:hypothetical protein
MARQYDAGGQESYLDLAGASAQAIANADARYQAALAAQGIPQAQIAAMLASAKASATAAQVGRDSLASPRETAQALFEGKVQGAGLYQGVQQTGSPIRKDDIYKVQEVTQLPARLLSSGMIFNYSQTADMTTNPSNYRAFARAFNNDKGSTPILAGQRRIVGQPTLLPSTPPAAGLNGTNTFSWTGQAWAGQTRYSYFNGTSQYIAPIVGTQVGYQPSNLTSNGIGIDIWINFDFTLPKLWNVTLFYYDSPFFPAGTLQSTKLCTNNVFEYKTINDLYGNPIIITNQKPIRSDDINYNAGYSNLQLYFTIYGALGVQPAGFEPFLPANIKSIDVANRSTWPRLVWTCA